MSQPTRLKFLRAVRDGKLPGATWRERPSKALTKWAFDCRFIQMLQNGKYALTSEGVACVTMHDEEGEKP